MFDPRHYGLPFLEDVADFNGTMSRKNYWWNTFREQTRKYLKECHPALYFRKVCRHDLCIVCAHQFSNLYNDATYSYFIHQCQDQAPLGTFKMANLPGVGRAEPPDGSISAASEDHSRAYAASGARAAALTARLASNRPQDQFKFVAPNPERHEFDIEVDNFFTEEPMAWFRDESVGKGKTKQVINDPLEWWRQPEIRHKYPLLLKAMRKFSAIPASEAPCERVFNIVSNIVNKRRTRLLQHRVSQLLFLNSNSK